MGVYVCGVAFAGHGRQAQLCGAGAGLFVEWGAAGIRHVWLQGAGLTVDACQMPFAWMLEQSWEQALKMLVLGGPDCTSLTWSFVDLTLPEWSLLAFLSLSALPLSWLLGYRMRQLGKG